MKIFLILFSVAVVARSGPVVQPEVQKEPVLRSVIGNFVNCVNSDLSLCLKEHALKAAERINGARKLDIIDGITIFNTNPRAARSYEPLSSDPDARKKQVTERLLENTADLIENGELEISYNFDDDEGESRDLGDVEEGRGKKKKLKKGKKKLKMLLPLAMIIKAKAMIIIAIAVKIIAISLFKLSIIAKIAFLSKIFSMLKELLSKKKGGDDHHHEHVEVHDSYGPPGYDSSAGGPYSRSITEANDLAYSAYRQQ